MPTIQFGVQYNGLALGNLVGPLEFAQRMQGLGYQSYFVLGIGIDPATLIIETQNNSVETMEEFVEAGITYFPINSLCNRPAMLANYEQFSSGILPNFDRRL